MVCISNHVEGGAARGYVMEAGFFLHTAVLIGYYTYTDTMCVRVSSRKSVWRGVAASSLLGGVWGQPPPPPQGNLGTLRSNLVNFGNEKRETLCVLACTPARLVLEQHPCVALLSNLTGPCIHVHACTCTCVFLVFILVWSKEEKVSW